MTQTQHGQRDACAAEPSETSVRIPVQPAPRSILVGDDIENPGNAAALADVAAMFGWDCGLLSARGTEPPGDVPAGRRAISREQLLASRIPLLVLENTDGADDLYGYQPPPGAPLALIVGNERKGVSRAMRAGAYQTLRIPVGSRRINTLNVAAAAAVALYFLSQGGRGRMRTRPDPERCRPSILFAAPADPIELGSAVRSAAALGWRQLFLDDRHGVWFGADRVIRSLGRGAARRGRNDLHVQPIARRCDRFDEACIVTADGPGEPLERADLARGREQLIVLPDPSGALPAEPDVTRLARRIRRVRVGLLTAAAPPRFRLLASIVLAESARQVGSRQRPQRHPRSAGRADAMCP